MKKNKLILVTTTGALLLGLSSVRALAEETAKVADTETNVTFKEGNTLTLNHVPDAFSFETEVSNKTYNITSGDISDADETFTNQVVVFNNKAAQKWEVSVSLSGLKDGVNSAVITNPELKITSDKNNEATTASGTGKNNVVFKNAGTTAAENVGTFANPIKGISISFEDQKGQIKADSKLTGQVHYTLAATADSE